MKLDVKEFDGTATVESWLVKVARYFPLHADSIVLRGEQWTRRKLHYGLMTRLTSSAQVLGWHGFRDIPDEKLTPECFLHKLKIYHYYRGGLDTVIQLNNCKQLVGEPLQDYLKCLRSIGVEHREAEESWYVEAFMRGIKNREMIMYVRGKRSKSISEVVNGAVYLCGDYGEGRDVDWQEVVRCYASTAESPVVPLTKDNDQYWSRISATQRVSITIARQLRASQKASSDDPSSDERIRKLDVGNFNGSVKLET